MPFKCSIFSSSNISSISFRILTNLSSFIFLSYSQGIIFGMSLTFQNDNHDYIRELIVLSLISRKPIVLNIAGKNEIYFRCLKKLFDIITQVTNGTEFSIDTGTIRVTPGVILGGEYTFYCDKDVDLSFYIEPISVISLYAKKFFRYNFFGSTFSSTSNLDISRSFFIEILRRYTNSDISLKILLHSNTGKGNAVLSITHSEFKPFVVDCATHIESLSGLCLTSLPRQNTNRFITEFRKRLDPICSRVYLSHNALENKNPTFFANIYGLDESSLPNFSIASTMEPFISIEDFSSDFSLRFFQKVLKGRTLFIDYLWVLLILMSFNSDSLSSLKNIKYVDRNLIEIVELFADTKFVVNRIGSCFDLSCIGNGLFKSNKIQV